MLKRFLKLFQNDEEPPTEGVNHPHQDQVERGDGQTYLAFLFQSIMPRVERRLTGYPDTDPTLEVATGLLWELFPDRWEEAEGPLVDEFTPAPEPPAPPATEGPPTPPGGDEGEQEAGAGEIDEALEERQEQPQSHELSDTSEIVDIDALGAAEEQGDESETSAPAGFVSALDETAEFAPPKVDDGPLESPWPMALDEEAVLQGARVLLAVLLDNDRLPESRQLEVADVVMAAELWIRLMARAVDVNERVQNLARLVEQKFEKNQFSQARLLLKLFPSNRPTQVNNDRQLFFEEMIYRMGIQRGGLSGGGESLPASLEAADLSDDGGTRTRLSQLAEQMGIEMHVYTRKPGDVERWSDLASVCSNPAAAKALEERIPPRRWRRIEAQGERTVATALREHLVRPMARDVVIGHIKTCYFILRAVGDTGLENYLDAFFDWSQTQCEVDATAYLPRLHRQVQENQRLIDEIFAEVYDEYYGAHIADKLDALDDEAMAEAFEVAMGAIAEVDVTDVPEGQFDLGALVLDAHLGLEYPAGAFAFKLHRLT